jgi:hypothetical protein
LPALDSQRLDASAWETGIMVFVADDLGAWLTALLADAGRKKMTTFALGNEQERALRSAATVAIQSTADELCPGDVEERQHMALVISQVFKEPMPTASLATHNSVLEALQAGVGGQLALLGDADLTGTGQSSADVLGTPAAMLAETLTVTSFGKSWFAGRGEDRYSRWPPSSTMTRLIGGVSRFIMRCANLAGGSGRGTGWSQPDRSRTGR